ncbi:MAG: hypothetical protein AAB654_04570, partial [Acidobacteriota bacterium]
FAGLTSFSAVTGFALSNELPAARYLYIAASSAVSRIDLSNGVESGRVPFGSPTGKVSFAGPASLGPAVSGLGYNANQNVPPSTALRPLIARFLDVNGKPAAGVPVSWASAAPDVVFGERGALTTKEGFVQALVTAPALAGTYSVIATSGAAKVQFDFLATTGGGGGGAVTPGGGGIFIFSGNGQLVQEQYLSSEPLVVLVKNPDGSPAAGRQVTFEMTQGNVSLSGSSVYSCSAGVCMTDVNGKTGTDFTTSVTGGGSIAQAVVTARLDNGVGIPFNIVIFQAGSGGMFGSTFASPPSVVLIKPALGETITGGVGETLPGAIQVFVASGTNAPVQNVGLAATTGLDAADGQVVSCPPNLLSDASGNISCDLTFGGKLGGPTTMTINVGGYRAYTSRVIVKAGPPAQMRIVAGNNQSGGAGQKLPTAAYIEVTDSGGNLLAGVPVSWEIVQQGTLTLANAQTVTDANGRARADVTLGSTPGVAALRVKSASATVTFSFTVSVKITTLVKTGGDGQQALVNQPYALPLGVQVLDDFNRPVPATTVAFSVL